MIKIRSLQKDDGFNDLISLSHDFFNEYETHHKEFFKIDNLRDEDIIRYFSHWRDHEKGDVFIALDGDRIVGYLTAYVKSQADYWDIKEVGDISGLMVDKAYRRLGIAGRLLVKARDFFERQSIQYFMVFTAVANLDAIRFYERNGLAPIYTTLLGDIHQIPCKDHPATQPDPI